MQIKTRAYVVTESNSSGIKYVSRFIFIAVRPEVLQDCAVQSLCTQHQMTQATVAPAHLITVTKFGLPQRRKFLFYLNGFRHWPKG